MACRWGTADPGQTASGPFIGSIPPEARIFYVRISAPKAPIGPPESRIFYARISAPKAPIGPPESRIFYARISAPKAPLGPPELRIFDARISAPKGPICPPSSEYFMPEYQLLRLRAHQSPEYQARISAENIAPDFWNVRKQTFLLQSQL